jgi:hypothetical protein
MVGGKTTGGLWMRPERTETRKSWGGTGENSKKKVSKESRRT